MKCVILNAKKINGRACYVVCGVGECSVKQVTNDDGVTTLR